jgi:hypothetical protein
MAFSYRSIPWAWPLKVVYQCCEPSQYVRGEALLVSAQIESGYWGVDDGAFAVQKGRCLFEQGRKGSSRCYRDELFFQSSACSPKTLQRRELKSTQEQGHGWRHCIPNNFSCAATCYLTRYKYHWLLLPTSSSTKEIIWLKLCVLLKMTSAEPLNDQVRKKKIVAAVAPSSKTAGSSRTPQVKAPNAAGSVYTKCKQLCRGFVRLARRLDVVAESDNIRSGRSNKKTTGKSIAREMGCQSTSK